MKTFTFTEREIKILNAGLKYLANWHPAAMMDIVNEGLSGNDMLNTTEAVNVICELRGALKQGLRKMH